MELIPLLFYFLIIIPSAIFHEFAHGAMADKLGDPTARYAGRLTLDPRPHIDKVGTIIMPIVLFLLTRGQFLFAYAKPVPYNPYNLRAGRMGPVLVALAGPVANFSLAFVFGLAVQFLPAGTLTLFLSVIVYANVMLGVFNLVPIPPLDGSKLLFAILPTSWSGVRDALERYGFMVFLFFIFFLSSFISPIVRFLYSLFTAGQGLF